MSLGTETMKVLYGVCGIGLGHLHRQLPFIQELANRGSRMVIFAYGASYQYLEALYRSAPDVSVIQVAVPYLPRGENGLDFAAAAELEVNQESGGFGLNCRALQKATDMLGRPDLVLTDYEPIAAQYAYAYRAPLITVDQQSKYLIGDSWPTLDGLTCVDEVMRLRMFFPRAEARLASSFFRIDAENGPEQERVTLVGPVIRDAIVSAAHRVRRDEQSALVYLSPQCDTGTSFAHVLEVLAAVPNWRFQFFMSKFGLSAITDLPIPKNVRCFTHGDPAFLEHVKSCSAVICTAGHTLLSEMLHLNIPVFALPLRIYEQQMNAHIIERNGLGVAHHELSQGNLTDFLVQIPIFKANFKSNSEVLFKESGRESIMLQIRQFLRPLFV